MFLRFQTWPNTHKSETLACYFSIFKLKNNYFKPLYTSLHKILIVKCYVLLNVMFVTMATSLLKENVACNLALMSMFFTFITITYQLKEKKKQTNLRSTVMVELWKKKYSFKIILGHVKGEINFLYFHRTNAAQILQASLNRSSLQNQLKLSKSSPLVHLWSNHLKKEEKKQIQRAGRYSS